MADHATAGRLDEARRLISARDFSGAEAICKAELAQGNPEALQLLGYTYQQSGQYELAVETLGKVTNSETADWSNFFLLGFSLRALGKIKEARAAFARANELSPARVDAAAALIDVTSELQGAETAHALFKRLSEQSQSSDWAVEVARDVKSVDLKSH